MLLPRCSYTEKVWMIVAALCVAWGIVAGVIHFTTLEGLSMADTKICSECGNTGLVRVPSGNLRECDNCNNGKGGN